jgi:hypothetical protein
MPPFLGKEDGWSDPSSCIPFLRVACLVFQVQFILTPPALEEELPARVK